MKYIACYKENKFDELISAGFKYLFENNGVWYFENNPELNKKLKFSKSKKFNDDDVREFESLNF
jgi:hypothetical protein